MNHEIEETVHLIKKCYNQPVIFHILLAHLSFLLNTLQYSVEPVDDWIRILVPICSKFGSVSSHSLETKILQLLKELRIIQMDGLDSYPNAKLRLMLVCYYMSNRPVNILNHFILFELVTNFLGISDYFDGLIIGLITKLAVTHLFGLQGNKKVRPDLMNKMINRVMAQQLSENNRIKLLGMMVNHTGMPFKLNELEISDKVGDNFRVWKLLEYSYFYAKYAKDTTYVKEVLPDKPEFIEHLKKYIENEYKIEIIKQNGTTNWIINEDANILQQIRRAYHKTENKTKLIADMLECINDLKNNKV